MFQVGVQSRVVDYNERVRLSVVPESECVISQPQNRGQGHASCHSALSAATGSGSAFPRIPGSFFFWWLDEGTTGHVTVTGACGPCVDGHLLISILAFFY